MSERNPDPSYRQPHINPEDFRVPADQVPEDPRYVIGYQREQWNYWQERALETEAQLAAAEAREQGYREALGFIESAALFHPDQAWTDEMKAQLRRVGKLAHEALTPPGAGG